MKIIQISTVVIGVLFCVKIKKASKKSWFALMPDVIYSRGQRFAGVKPLVFLGHQVSLKGLMSQNNNS